MSDVTIDTLAVEITSNSAGAAKGIDELAASLMKLKGTTISSTAVKNLTDLTGALRGLGSVTSEAKKIGDLADNIRKLSTVGSMNKVINQLNKLPGAVKGLSGITIDQSLTDKVNGLTQALQPLTTIKSGGLGTMINALAKIGKVTDSLDDDTIGRFADRVKKLNESLGPLSTKMTTVQQGFKSLNSSAKTAGSGVKELGTKVNATALNLASAVTVIRGLVSALMPLVRIFSDAIGQAMEWDGISYQFGNAFGEEADKYYEDITRITDALMINKQTFMENSAMASSMLHGFGVGAQDARKMGVGYTELAYDLWAAFNNVYKTFDGAQGAMAAVRSAIAGEVEPIRRAGFTIVESELEITAALNGIEYSSEKATEAQKSYLRYLTLVRQASNRGIIGAYANEMGTAEGLTRILTQQLKGLAQTFGSVFLPVLVKVMPWLQAFIEILNEAIITAAAFFGIDIQPVSWGDSDTGLGGIADSANAATDAVDKTTDALKDLKKATIGIDELNVISPPNKNGGSGSTGSSGGFDGLDIDSLWDATIFQKVQSQVDDIKARLEGMLPIVGGIAAAFAGWKLAKFIADLSDVSLKLVNMLPFAKSIGDGINKALMKAFGGTSFAWIGTVLSTKLINALKMVGTTIAAIPGWAAALVVTIAGAIALAIIDYDFTNIGYKIGNAVGKALRSAADFIEEIGAPIIEGINSALEWVSEQLEGKNLWEKIVFFALELPFTALAKIGEIGADIVEGIIEGMWNGLQNLWGNITEFVDGFIQGFKDGFEIHSPSRKFIQIGEQIIAGLLQPFSFSTIKKEISGFLNSVVDMFSGSKAEQIDVPVGLEKSGWRTVSEWIGEIPPVSAGIKLVKSGWSTVKNWLGNLDFKLNFRLPKIGINWGSSTFAGFKISYPKGFYTYAKGGFPDMGELFVANEAGPEMVGKIGNKTTVANNDQIVEAVSEGVYQAVLAAMRQSEGNGGQAVNVYLDGRQITSSVEKRQRERGATIMRNGVYAY